MCGRYALAGESLTAEALERARRAFGLAALPVLKSRYNVAPEQLAPVLREQDGAHVWQELRWGFRPSWLVDRNRAQINARAETVFESRMFKPSALRRRCLVPASGWYEWQSRPDGKQPFYFHPKDNGLIAFAGIWTSWGKETEREESYATLTTTPNKLAATVHNRMPAIVDESHFTDWLDPENQDASVLTLLLRPSPDSTLGAYPVSRRVNNVKNDTPECIVPVKGVA